ncbi:hypothetical protein F8O01_04495 [Pseudoclavibacter chungangensis]|uniref:Uncharacterized protein n=1 Tax=Pseudoclavibacter chungangensis TaxID=587635 RepID=A0A7J5BZV2_9MICO|nr:hypothetical protein [Pseudoclavibacter chungangensis]KAB1660185.1 hypothetical protein F8O01_04495 [Pseudoclavibacter chungangensis]NYJ66700.1 CHASE2 domain-containing sensor protein [Pseudoclavibacter chungangensis]
MSLPLLTITYSRLYGVSTTQPAGPRSTRLLLTILTILVAALASNLAITHLAASAWWGLIPAVVAFVSTIVLGRSYDDALRDELRGTTERAG